MKKFAVMEITTILGDRLNKDLKVIEANTEEEAITIYKSTRPHLDRYNCEVRVHEVK